MLQLTPLEPIDYLVVGHLTRDLTPTGPRLGGTAAYAALTAAASFPTDQSTTFENVATPQGRIQYIRHVAPRLDFFLIPEPWRSASIVHLGPVAQEVEPSLARSFSSSLVGVTPQGWLRAWGPDGRVFPCEWPEASFVLANAGAAVISIEDVGGDETRIEELASSSRVLAVTEAHHGARLYWNGDVRRFRAPDVAEVDATGAGDIFAASFFFRLYTTRDPWEAARFATQLSALSVTRPGLSGIPTADEVHDSMVEVY
jgi:sugar/nucleoside kinase (ribokinase family)